MDIIRTIKGGDEAAMTGKMFPQSMLATNEFEACERLRYKNWAFHGI